MKPAVILDKCFLQGAPASSIKKLASTHRLVMSSALFYELLTCDSRGRKGCFFKLPNTENPVELVEHASQLIKNEIKTHRPSGKPSLHKEDIRFRFNSKLVNNDYELPLEAKAAIREQSDMLQSDIKQFIEQANLTPIYFPDLFTGTDEERTNARHEAEKKITANRFLLPLYSQLKSPEPQAPFPPHNLLDESWAIYRWLQVQLLFGLDLFVRYAGNIPDHLTKNIYIKLEHDVLDAQVLMLGCLEGAFATREKKLIRWWHLLCPNGELFQ
jgi:hypothetical protein